MINEFEGKEVCISAKRYYDLLKSEDELDALDCAGVDNWSGYSEYREYLNSDDDLLDDVREHIII